MDDHKSVKSSPVLEEKFKYVSTVDPSRRSGKAVNLLDEKIDENLYEPRAKTSGFGTLRPLEWMCSFEKCLYSNIEHVSSEWFNITNKDNNINECQLYFYYGGAKFLTLHAFLATGVILAKGKLHREWAEHEFPSFLTYLKSDCTSIKEILPTDEFTQAIKATNVSLNKAASKNSSPPKSDENTQITTSTDLSMITEQPKKDASSSSVSAKETELDKIWEENMQIKNALKTIEANLLNVNKALENIEQTLQDKDSRFENAIKAFETKIDSRISLEVEIIQKDLDTEIKKISNKLNDKIINMKHSMDDKMKEFEEFQSKQAKDFEEKVEAFEIQRAKEIELWQNEKDQWYHAKEEWKYEKEELLRRMKDNIISNQVDLHELNEPSDVDVNKTTNTQVKDNTHEFVTVTDGENSRNDKKITNEDDIIILMDSNRRFVAQDKINPDEKLKVKIIPCHNFQQCLDVIDTVAFAKAKVIILHFGVNDIESQSTERFCLNMKHAVTLLRSKYPNAQLLVSEITPRMDSLNIKVKECNAHLKSVLGGDPKVYIIYHSFLDNEEYFYDRKHIRKDFINKLASNLKKAMRRALGIYNPWYNRGAFQAGNRIPMNSNIAPYRMANPTPIPQAPIQPAQNMFFPQAQQNNPARAHMTYKEASNINQSAPVDLRSSLAQVIDQLQKFL